MRPSLCAALLASVAGAAAAGSSRPAIVPSPKQPRVPVPNPAARTKLCTVKTHGNGSDDSAYILSAFHKCNDGGKILFPKNTTYTIGTAMDWTFLKHVDIGKSHINLLGHVSSTARFVRVGHKRNLAAQPSRRVPAVMTSDTWSSIAQSCMP